MKRQTAEQVSSPTSEYLVAGVPGMATEDAIRAWSRAQRREDTQGRDFGHRKSDWGRKAASAYTWLRTDRGP